jgi:hypothetical protein
MIEVAYLNEVKFRNQVRRDLKGVSAVANKADRYHKGYAHVEPVWREPDWFKVWFYDAGWSHDAGRPLKIAQTLHLLGYEVKFIKVNEWGSEKEIAVYRKAGN